MKNPMLPIWLMYPYLTVHTENWTIDENAYNLSLLRWLDSLSVEERNEYYKLFPVPKVWTSHSMVYLNNSQKSESNNILTDSYSNEHHTILFWEKHGQPVFGLKELIQEQLSGNKHKFLYFWGGQPAKDGSINKSCFSQWWFESFMINHKEYCCMEQYMMAEKARLFGDTEVEQQIMNCKIQKQIKALGRMVRNFNDDIWNQCKYSIVLTGNYYKFLQNPRLKDFLIYTEKRILAEASPYDAIWGIHLKEEDPNAGIPTKWKGQNLLGFALMEVRSELIRICGKTT